MKKEDKRLDYIERIFQEAGIDIRDDASIKEKSKLFGAVYKFSRSRYLFCKDIKSNIYNNIVTWFSKIILLAVGYLMLLNASDIFVFLKQYIANLLKIK